MSDELKEKGMTAYRSGDYASALDLFRQAAAAYAAAEQPAEQGEVLNNIGVIYRMQKQYDAAEAALDEAETLFAANGDLNRRAQTIGNRGDLRSDQKRADEAAAAYRAAADLFAQDGDGWKGAQVLRALSLLQLRRRQITASILTMYESLATRPRLGPGQWLMKQLFGFAVRLLGGV